MKWFDNIAEHAVYFLDKANGNLDALSEQWGEWSEERDQIVKPGIRQAWADFKRMPSVKRFAHVVHKCHAWTEEIIDKNPRLYSYLAYPRRVFEAISLILILKELIG